MAHLKTNWQSCAGLIIFAVGIMIGSLNAQDESPKAAESVRNIYAEAFVYASENSGKCRADIYIQVPYSEISFVKEGEQYTGRYEIAAAVFSQDKQQVWQKNQLMELHLKDFSQTVSSQLSNLKQFSTDLLPGKYELNLQVKDLESGKIANLQRQLSVKDLGADSLALSDLMLVSRMSADGEQKSIVPNLTGVFGKEPDKFYLFFEIYNSVKLDSVQLVCKFIDSKHKVIEERTKSEILSSHRTQAVWQIDTPMLAAGQYSFLVEATVYTKADSILPLRASVSHSCVIRMQNLPLTITDIDKATDQLLYIAQGSEIDYIREAPTSEKKLNRFLEFWAKRDPDPKTTRNELMEEYYYRVDYANKNFSHLWEGWRTDRGMVLIRFGMPQNVERHPFESNSKPYEIWHYNDQNREFVFIDENGFGDYRLQYPETDLWGRMR
jgi:GWxTD domain-containing protein